MKIPMNRWSMKEQAVFLKKVGELLEQGFTLTEALDFIKIQFSKKNIVQIDFALKELKEGYPFYSILKKIRFHHELIGFVYFAEQHGNLSIALKEGSENILKRTEDKEKLLKILTYPTLLIIIVIFLMSILKLIILPQFTTLSINIEDNKFAKLVFIVSDIFILGIWIIVTLIILILVIHFAYLKRKTPILLTSILVKVPYIGKIFSLLYTQYFSVQFSYLLSGGFSVYDILTLFIKNESHPLFQEIATRLKNELKDGVEIYHALMVFPFFEKEMAQVFLHGQKSGKLEKELFYYSRYCLQELEEMTKRALKLIQPTIFSLIGMIIISMYLAIMMPLFNMLDNM